MKFAVSISLMMLMSFASCLFFPWWSIALTCFLVSVIIPQKKWTAFICGFVAIFLLWFCLCFWISFQNNNLLAHRISLLILKTDNPFLLITLSSFLGALVGGFASLTGAFMQVKSSKQ